MSVIFQQGTFTSPWFPRGVFSFDRGPRNKSLGGHRCARQLLRPRRRASTPQADWIWGYTAFPLPEILAA